MTNQYSTGFSKAYWQAYELCWAYHKANPEATLLLSVYEGTWFDDVMIYDEDTGDIVYWDGCLTPEETKEIALVVQEFTQ